MSTREADAAAAARGAAGGSEPAALRATPAGSRRRWATARFPLVLAGLGGLLVAATLLAISVGAVAVPVGQSWRIVLHHLVPGGLAPTWTPLEDRIIWEFRMPRALLAILVGATLAVTGAVLQTLVRNMLAEPFLLGVSQGASLGAVLVFVLGAAALGGLGLSAAAFLGALLAMVLVYLLAQRSGRITPARLVLAGVALAFLFQAMFSYLLLKAGESGRAAQQIVFWLLGSLGGARWDVLALPAVALLAGLAVLLAQHRPLNALGVGDETATALGVAVPRLRAGLFVLVSLLVGAVVAISGAIAFVGLIVPHAARLLVGADHVRLLPVSALLGAVFLQLADIVARTAAAPTELPMSVVTALVGVPLFLWLLRRRAAEAPVGAA